MKALTVQPPWASAIIHGLKGVENRTQNWSYRGPLAIHSGKRWSQRGVETIERLAGRYYLDAARGAIIGVVELVDAHPDAGCCKPWGEQSYVEHGGTNRVDIVHLVLENARPIDPIPCPGRLGLWTPSADVLLELANGATA